MVKTYEEINAKIKSGDVVVVNAEDMIKIVEEKENEKRKYCKYF